MKLNSEIESLNELLKKYGEGNWKLPLVYSRNDVTRIMQMFGGMGSLNDLYICEMNGHAILKSDETVVNERIREHLTNIHNGCIKYASKS